MKVGGQRSSNKQRKAKERNNNMKTADSAIHDLTQVFTPKGTTISLMQMMTSI
jgi:hypothetical protein